MADIMHLLQIQASPDRRRPSHRVGHQDVGDRCVDRGGQLITSDILRHCPEASRVPPVPP